MKAFQVLYGYILLSALLYWIVKGLALLTSFSTISLAFIIFPLLFLIKVTPHSDRERYPFAFGLKLHFLHRN